MLLFAGEHHLFASHLSRWQAPYDFQAFVKVMFVDQKIQQDINHKLQAGQEYYILLVEHIDKERLMSGESLEVKVRLATKQTENPAELPLMDASIRSLFYRQIEQDEAQSQYEKYEKYYSVRSGNKSFLFNRVSKNRPFEHIVSAENQCTEYQDSLEVRLLKSNPQPVFSGSLKSLDAIAKKYGLKNLSTIYLDKKGLEENDN